MKTEHELNADILKIIMTIQETYPELSKYLVEMPIPNTIAPERKLKDYYDSLDNLLKKYAAGHSSTVK